MCSTDILDSIKNRRSIRSYKPDMIPDDVIDEIVESGTYAATDMGRQSPIIIVVKDKSVRDRLSKLNAEIMGADKDPFYGAPVVLIVLADRSSPTHVYDGSLVREILWQRLMHLVSVAAGSIGRRRSSIVPRVRRFSGNSGSMVITKALDTASSVISRVRIQTPNRVRRIGSIRSD